MSHDAGPEIGGADSLMRNISDRAENIFTPEGGPAIEQVGSPKGRWSSRSPASTRNVLVTPKRTDGGAMDHLSAPQLE